MERLRDAILLHIDLNGIITPVWLINVFPTSITCVVVKDKNFISVPKNLIIY